jgi:hypothetical protein
MKVFSTLLFLSSIVNAYVHPKFCIDCRHFVVPNNRDNRFGKCKAFPIEKTNFFLITKEIVLDNVDFRHCSTARNLESLCGIESKRFEPKDDLREPVYAR